MNTSFDKAYDSIISWVFPDHDISEIKNMSLEEKLNLGITDKNVINILKSMDNLDSRYKLILPQYVMSDISTNRSNFIYLDELIRIHDVSYDIFLTNITRITKFDKQFFDELIYLGDKITIIIPKYYLKRQNMNQEYKINSNNGFTNGYILYEFTKILSKNNIETKDCFLDSYYFKGFELKQDKYKVRIGCDSY